MDCPPANRASLHPLRNQFLINNLSALAPPILVLVFAPGWGWQGALQSFLYSVLFANIIGTLASVIMPRLFARIHSQRSAIKWSVAVTALMAVAIVGSLLGTGLLWLGGVTTEFWRDYRISVQIAVLITLTFGVGGMAYETLRRQLEQTTLELRTKELERERALKLATEARLSSLESRLHPHFLFNTLNSVSSLIREDPQRAERLIGQMAALLRFSLDSTQTGSVPLEKEIRIVSDYLEIEKARFGDRLRYEIQMPATLGGIEVPPLIIQTLVENSVKYAIAPRREGGFIQISGTAVDGRIHMEVTDDGPGFGADALLPGHGLDNLQSRLLALYGLDAALSIRRTDRGMSVTVSLPQTRAAVRS